MRNRSWSEALAGLLLGWLLAPAFCISFADVHLRPGSLLKSLRRRLTTTSDSRNSSRPESRSLVVPWPEKLIWPVEVITQTTGYPPWETAPPVPFVRTNHYRPTHKTKSWVEAVLT